MDIVPGSLNYWFLQTIAMMITAFLLPGLTVKGPLGAFVMVVSLAYVNAKVWDAALFFQLPDSITVHTIVLLLCNGTLFWVLVKILPGIEIEGFWPAIFAPIVFTVLSVLVSYYLKDVDWLLVLEKCLDYVKQLRDQLSGGTGSSEAEPLSGSGT